MAVKFRNAADIVRVANARGYKVHLKPGPPPMPVLLVPGNTDKSLVTDALLGALRAWRLEIIELLKQQESA